jgi:hypothetical protein
VWFPLSEIRLIERCKFSNVSANCAIYIFTRGAKDRSSYTDLPLGSMSQKEREYYEDLDVGGKIILEWILER